MIVEFLTSLLTPAPKWAKDMEYLNEAIAIEARARRCGNAWAPHQQHTKDVILDAIKACDQHRTLLVVGSGACLDLPLADLADVFERILLIDIVHPLKAKRHRWNHVLHVTLDITGQMETLYDNPEHLPEMSIPDFYHDVSDIDCVLSVNLASQLPVIPLKYLAHKDTHDEHNLDRFAKDLLVAHFTWLSSFTCATVLICDKAWEKLDVSGHVIETHDPLYGLISQQTTNEWYWDVAPRHETGTKFSRRNRVGYWSNFLFTDSDNLSEKPCMNSNCRYV